ncbi:oligopeptide/dipeptide ABC transporter ATP-binding protein [Actinopolymorpha pittospori]
MERARRRPPDRPALLRSVPRLGTPRRQRLDTVRGVVPPPYQRPSGCPFHSRCDDVMPGRCDQVTPEVVRVPVGGAQSSTVRCLLYDGEGDA